MKRLFALLLALMLVLALTACGCEHEFAPADCVNPSTCTLCGETEGNPLGHVWMAATCDTPKTCEVCGTADGEPKGHAMVEATCEEAKHCENCNLTEGEALGHKWLEATTDAPQTCETCGATEGEPIVTDPRFTTAATKELHGKWALELPLTEEDMGIPGFNGEDCAYLVADFGNDGSLSFVVEVTDTFTDALKQATVDALYAEFELEGIDKETADAAFADTYDMTIQEYVDQEFSVIDFSEFFNAAFGALNLSGVYYVEDGLIYTGDSWDAEMLPEAYSISGDVLTIEGMDVELGADAGFVRVKE